MKEFEINRKHSDVKSKSKKGKMRSNGNGEYRPNSKETGGVASERKVIDKGYQPTCNCNAEFEAGTVLDIFMGSGTTGLVAEKLNRKWVGIDLNKEYCEIAKARIKSEREQIKFRF